ncbi:nucleoside deaminase [Panacibacter ginsenosidivorans]|uniref:tRNA-specific adenosine deaminase n=1 Tax=Panacibacter ginsenosidivorans TaxID=1813871 RepID=A0A5B8VAM0_9BACT|nr:nucleoside deaminase [Panacibacter ginsenosidivorans]QEC67736.1 nucleoside deaminase [Panacibacter ginsenosidivorans]
MLSISDEYFMQQALKEAQKAFDTDEVPVGAVIVINNKIIARAHNQVELLNDPTAHAEILAITTACNYLGAKYLPDAALYVTIEPCLMCCGALYWSKIGKIVYGAPDIKNGYRKYIHASSQTHDTGEAPFHVKTEIIKGMLQDECAALIKEFFKRKR